MKFLHFDDYRVGVLKGENVVDITAIAETIPHRDALDLMTGLVANYASLKDEIARALETEGSVPLSGVKIRAPLPRSGQIDCMATNYMEDGTLDKPFAINAFHKSPRAVIGPEETLVMQDIPATCFEAEAELALVIGKRAYNVSEEEAMDYVFGYTNFIDGSARGLPAPNNSFFQVKSRDTFAPMGPFLVTADEVPNPQSRWIKLWINGELRQDFNTDDMAYSIPRCISWMSSVHPLEAGDIIATGTNHRGLSALHDGDVIELENEGLGRLRIHVRDDLKRTYTRDTRLQGNEKRKAAGGEWVPTGVVPRQLSGKYTPA